MADIFVRKNGNDTTGNGATGTPYLTIAKGLAVATSGDRVIVGNGTYTNEATNGSPDGLVMKTGVTVRAENTPTLSGTTWSAAHTCIIDQQSLKTYGFLATGSKTDFSIEGIEIKNASGAGITVSECFDFSIKHCLIHHCGSNGISINSKCDLIWVEGNEVHNCASAASGRSGISILNAHPNPIGRATPADGFRVHILNNVSHDNLRGQTSDCNGIIIDKLHFYANKFEAAGVPYKTLVKGNYCYGNRGSGIRIMASKGCTVEYNTCYDNRIGVNPENSPPTQWVGGVSSQWANDNIFRYNIGFATKINEAGYTNVGNSNISYAYTQPSDDNTYTSNIFYNSHGPGDDVYKAPSSHDLPVNGVTGNQIGVNPLLVSPGTGNFQTQAGSPARGAAAGGLDIGAWQSGAAPDPDVTITTAPVLTLSTPFSGGTFELTLGTYSDTVTRTHQAQHFTGGAWTDVSVSFGGTNPLTGTIPEVAATGGFRIMERFTGTGAVSKPNPSNWIDISPAPATPDEAPVNTVLPVISGTESVGSTLTASTGTWTGRPSPTFTYQWKRAGVDIGGATAASYLLVAGDSGTVITCAVTATNSEGNATATSAGTAAIAGSTPDDDLTGLTARVGVLEGQLAALQANLTTLSTHVEVVDAALSTEVDLVKGRTSVLETSVVGAVNLEAIVSSQGAAIAENGQALGTLSTLDERITTLLAGGRLRLYLT